MKFNQNVYRPYDIRGIYEKDIDNNFAYTLGMAFGSILKEQNKNTTIVGYDNRYSSKDLKEYLIKGLNDVGINVINIGLVTTPMYYFSWRLLNITSGIMVTASHNPKEYNGFKLSFNGINNAYGQQIQELREYMEKDHSVQENKGNTTIRDIKDEYISFLLKNIKINRKLKVVIDAGNGTSSIIIKDIFDKLNVDYIPIFIDSNPNFPNHHPDPSVPENMKQLSNKVIETNADAGFAYDGDADRIGMVDENGKIVPVDHIMIIILRNIIGDLSDKRILFDVKCSRSLKDEIVKLGGTPIEYRTGNSYLRAKIVTDNILFGGELSGHIFLNDKFPGYDDGIYASLRIIEILSNTDKKVSELLEGINKYFSTPELKIHADDNMKYEIVDNIKKYCDQRKYKYLDIDGCKAIFEDGFALIRVSNTGPNITMRFEAKTEQRLNEIQNEFETKLKEMLN